VDGRFNLLACADASSSRAALLAVLTCGVAASLWSTGAHHRRASGPLQRGESSSSGAIVDQLRITRTETYTITAAPHRRLRRTLKAAVTTDAPDGPERARQVRHAAARAQLLVVTDANGAVMATTGDASAAARLLAGQPAVRQRADRQGNRQPAGAAERASCRWFTVPINLFLTRRRFSARSAPAF